VHEDSAAVLVPLASLRPQGARAVADGVVRHMLSMPPALQAVRLSTSVFILAPALAVRTEKSSLRRLKNMIGRTANNVYFDRPLDSTLRSVVTDLAKPAPRGSEPGRDAEMAEAKGDRHTTRGHEIKPGAIGVRHHRWVLLRSRTGERKQPLLFSIAGAASD